MGPRDAAQAAAILEARLTVPIHYGALHRPPAYAQVDAPAETFATEAAAAGIAARIVGVGEVV
jgi:L-ascorbate metabolism protein UlaG (beta-lactamase superfamily)